MENFDPDLENILNDCDKEEQETFMINMREHHYYFVQNFLYKYIRNRTSESMKMFCREDALTNLKLLWKKAFSSFKDMYPEMEHINSDSLSCSVTTIDETKRIVIVTLPQPQSFLESYFIGIYYKLEHEFADPEFKYFTLEYHNPEKTAFCELNVGKHTLWGIYENLNQDEFTELVKSKINEKVSPLTKTIEENLSDINFNAFKTEKLSKSDIIHIFTDCIDNTTEPNTLINIAKLVAEKLSDLTLTKEVFIKAEANLIDFYDYPNLATSVIDVLQDYKWGLELLEKARTIAKQLPSTIKYVVIAEAYCRWTKEKETGKELFKIAEKYATKLKEFNRLIESVFEYEVDFEYYLDLIEKADLLIDASEYEYIKNELLYNRVQNALP